MEMKNNRKGTRCYVTACVPSDMLEKISERDEDTTDKESVLKSGNASTDAEDEDNYVLLEKIKEQNRILSDLSTKVEEIFNLDEETSESTSESLPNSEQLSIKDRIKNFEYSLETNYLRPKVKDRSKSEPISEERCLRRDVKSKAGDYDEDVDSVDSDTECEFLMDMGDSDDSYALPLDGTVLIEKLENIVRTNYQSAKEMFEKKEKEYMSQIQNFELFHRLGKHGNNILKNKDLFMLYQSLLAEAENETKKSSLSLDNLPKERPVLPATHSEFSTDKNQRKTFKKTTPRQGFDKSNMKQFLAPDGLEEIKNLSKNRKRTTTAFKKKQKGVGEAKYDENDQMKEFEEELQRVGEIGDGGVASLKTSSMSETSLLPIDEKKVGFIGGDYLFSSPSDSKLLKCGSDCFFRDKYVEEQHVREDVHYGNPFRAVFRRAALMDIHQLYEFINFPFAENEVEESMKPISSAYINNLVISVNNFCAHQRKFRDNSRKVVDSIRSLMFKNDNDISMDTETSSLSVAIK